MTAAVTLAPVSKPVAKLLHQLQAQIIKDAQERGREVPPGSVVLPAIDATWEAGRDRITKSDSTGSYEEYRRMRFCPPSWIDAPHMKWHPSHWRTYSRRVDSEGRSWSRTDLLDIHVTDDFGFLVPLPECWQ